MTIKTILTADEYRTQYDKTAKRLIGSYNILARILKGTMQEFSDMPVEEIIRCIESVETNIPVNPGMTNSAAFRGLNTEDYVPSEGRVFFDLLTRVAAPLYRYLIEVNVEINNQTDRWKILLPRSVYYSARLLSAQGDRDFSIKNHEYDKAHKAVSIWISLGMPSAQADRIIRFSLKPEFVYGEPFVLKGNYDLLEIIHVTIGNKRSEQNELTGFLFTLLSGSLSADQKNELLTNEYGVDLDEGEREALDKMDGILEGYFKEEFAALRKRSLEEGESIGFAKGEAKGEAKGVAKGIAGRTNELILRKLRNGKTFEQACADLGLTEEEIREIKPSFETGD